MYLQVHVLLFKCLSLSLVLPEQVVLPAPIQLPYNLLNVLLLFLISDLDYTLFMIFSDLFLRLLLLWHSCLLLLGSCLLLSEYSSEYRTVIL